MTQDAVRARAGTTTAASSRAGDAGGGRGGDASIGAGLRLCGQLRPPHALHQEQGGLQLGRLAARVRADEGEGEAQVEGEAGGSGSGGRGGSGATPGKQRRTQGAAHDRDLRAGACEGGGEGGRRR